MTNTSHSTQYQPRPEFIQYIKQVTPQLNKSLKANYTFEMVSYSKDEKDPNQMQFFVKAGEKVFKLEVSYQQDGKKAKIQLKKLSELLSKDK